MLNSPTLQLSHPARRLFPVFVLWTLIRFPIRGGLYFTLPQVPRSARLTTRMAYERKFPIGAEVAPHSGGVHFRVWAPSCAKPLLLLGVSPDLSGPDVKQLELEPEDNGYWCLHVPHARDGMFYKYKLDSGAFPDPASRFQPDGPHGASQIIDPEEFQWTDADWRGVSPERRVVYELHIGTFTPEGAWVGAMKQLPELARLGITVLEVMPVAEFPGRFGWGYDGVDLFAPTRLYGRPMISRVRQSCPPTRHGCNT